MNTRKRKLNSPIRFPENFLWGTATAAHQVEGENRNNNWWAFEQEPNRIINGDRSGKACDHWSLYKKDFNFLKKLNQNAYRMSVEWSRIFPEPGKRDQEAINRYHKMIDTLLKMNITPFITLLHFTYPIWWDREGGLKNRKQAHLDHFREFCELIGTEFRDKVKYWNTINEPTIAAMLGFFLGEHPPGKCSILSTIRAVNTLLKMHTIAYHTIKGINPDSMVGIVNNMSVPMPLNSGSITDRIYTRVVDYIYNGCVIRALKTGKLISHIVRRYKGLKNSTDFIGLNFYNFLLISRDIPELASLATRDPLCGEEGLCSGIGWEPYPEGLLINLRRIHIEFPNIPVYITENGIGTDNDRWRQRMLIDHLKMCHQAIQEGVDLRGYFHWSMMDNFEWAEGFSSRFGIIDINFKTQKRTIKKSGKLYAEISKKNELTPEILKEFPDDIYRPRFSS